MYLSKSDFKIARTCPTKLYYKKRGYPSLLNEDEYLELLAEGGYLVERIAKLLYPEGREIGFDKGHFAAFQETMEALTAENATLFEPTLISRCKLARIDILIRRANEFQIIEVKAKSYDSRENAEALAKGRSSILRTIMGGIMTEWREYLEDIAFQCLVLKELFPDAFVRPYLMMPDKSKTTQIEGIHSLFQVRRVQASGSKPERIVVEFIGDAERLRRDHYLTLVPVGSETGLLLPEIRLEAERFVSSLQPALKKIPMRISTKCRDCEYRASKTNARDGYSECWGDLAYVRPHLFDLYHVTSVGGRGGTVANRLIRDKKVSLFDIRPQDLVNANGQVGERNKRQLIQLNHTRDNTEWFSEQLPAILSTFQYPLHFIDFETTSLAIPYHAGMHPYEPVAFQWSCHTLEAPGAMPTHAEWINVEDLFPNFEFGETLMRHLGRDGILFMWASHENTILRRILEQMADRRYRNEELSHWLQSVVRDRGQDGGRLVDMNQLCLKHYFHPLMRGRTSIKVVCDAVWKSNPVLRADFPKYIEIQNGEVQSPYASLPPLEINGQPVRVAEGTGAIRAYEAMMYGAERDDAELRSRWKQLLLQYCKLDTLSMVLIWKHWLQKVPAKRTVMTSSKSAACSGEPGCGGGARSAMASGFPGGS